MAYPTKYDPTHPGEQPVKLPDAPREPLSEGYMELQPPLSRRGHGPGIVAFLAPPPPQASGPKAETLDPEPVMKWAEEGYAVVAVSSDVPRNDVRKALSVAVNALTAHKDVDVKDKFAVFVYHPDLVDAVSEAVVEFPVCLLASYGAGVPKSCSVPVVEHTFVSEAGAAEAGPPPRPIVDHNFNPTTDMRRSYEYATRSGSPFSILPTYSDEVYDKGAAALTHTRTLTFLKAKIGGPWFDLENIWEEHTWFEFVGRSVAQTMGTMVAEPYVNHIPTMVGGTGRESLTAFYRDHFIFANPPDTKMHTVSRTVGIDRVIDEFIFECTHTTEWEWFLPGVPPTGKLVRVPFTAVVCIRGDRLYHEHIAWCQATALRQVGLLPDHVPYGQGQQLRLPVASGFGTTEKLLNDKKPSNEMFGKDWGVSALP